MTDTEPIRLCVVGATGRMGATIVKEAPKGRFAITGAVAAPGEPTVGRTLGELGLLESELRVSPPEALKGALESSDVCVSFTSSEAEIRNLPVVIAAGKPLVLGTTGFSAAEHRSVVDLITGRVPCVMTSNFSVGANMLFAVASTLKNLPSGFDVSILEMHHSGKADAPSGTARTIAEIVSRARGYKTTVHGREGFSKRAGDELEVASFRGGGMPGEHAIHAFGQHEMLKFEHLAFSRSAFSQGALLAAEWIVGEREPRVYSMLDVLGFKV